ncbi:hypothetical protein T09_15060 [Trichinella sp. T9]|nr:hypothetical protein T09_15060 [Trichinella sp. T9]
MHDDTILNYALYPPSNVRDPNSICTCNSFL